MENDFITRDEITGERGNNPLNKINLSDEELDDIFLDGCY